MRFIKKSKEPRSLTEYKKISNAYYDGYSEKNDVREVLLKDQGHLCAYCMKRITKDQMKIEHWLSQSSLKENEKKALDFSIMLGVCMGNEGQKDNQTTCDTHRKDCMLTVNPLDRNLIQQIKYKSNTGEIYSDRADIQKDLNEILNLNYNEAPSYLCRNRLAVLDACKKRMMDEHQSGEWTQSFLEHMLSIYQNADNKGKYKEYSGIVIWYLQDRLKR